MWGPRFEAAFLSSAACARLISEAGVRAARCYAADLRPVDAEPMRSRFALLLEDFAPADGWAQRWLLDEAEARAALSTLARMHAFFSPGARVKRSGAEVGGAAGAAAAAEAEEELRAAVWECGAYWQPAMQQPEQMTAVAARWSEHASRFADIFADAPELHDVDLATLGDRLHRVARAVGAEAHPYVVTGVRGPAEFFHSIAHQSTLPLEKPSFLQS